MSQYTGILQLRSTYETSHFEIEIALVGRIEVLAFKEINNNER